MSKVTMSNADAHRSARTKGSKRVKRVRANAGASSPLKTHIANRHRAPDRAPDRTPDRAPG